MPVFGGNIAATVTTGNQPYISSIGQSGFNESINGDIININSGSLVNITNTTAISGNVAGPLLTVTGNTALSGTVTQTLIFTSNSSWTAPTNVTFTAAKMLIVGGGGSGGDVTGSATYQYGGGGGSGGFLGNVNVLSNITAGTTYTITVGAGGSPPGSGQYGPGGNSVAFGYTAVGGGSGGIASSVNGQNGGSGGGGIGASGTGGSPTVGQGYAGGNGYQIGSNNNAGGGGGGAGAVGANATSGGAGAGGAGILDNITGVTVEYAHGGDGSSSLGAGSTYTTPGSGGRGKYFNDSYGLTGQGGIVVLQVTYSGQYGGITTSGVVNAGNINTTGGVFWNNGVSYATTTVSNISANLGAYQLYANANIGTLFNGNITTNANLGAFQTYANANFITTGGTYGNSNVASYLASNSAVTITTTANISSRGNVTAGNIFIPQTIGTGYPNNWLLLGSTPDNAKGGFGIDADGTTTNFGSIGGNVLISASGGAFEWLFNSAGNLVLPSTSGVSYITYSDGSVYGGSGGSQTPWTSNIAGAGFYLTNAILETTREKQANIGVVQGTVNINANLGPIQSATVTANITINTNNLSNFATGQSVTLVLTQNTNANLRILTSNLKYAGGSKVLSNANAAIDSVTILYDGTNYLAALVKGYS